MRAFALEVVTRLREAGFTALWAGGCVRDLLLGTSPHDYDVATDARPPEVRKLFRRTIAVGAQFGVIEVLGPEPGLHVQVATFRSDGTYSDGRHPDSVRFGTVAEDAQRRDFTINGLFFDPVAEQVLDYVGGQADLQTRLVRAIGDPRERIKEDKLRMLRAIRFVARLGFTLEARTQDALVELHHDLPQVSAERITDELKKMFVIPGRARAAELMLATRMLPVLLPEFAWPDDPRRVEFPILGRLPAVAAFPLTWSALLLDVALSSSDGVHRLDGKYVHELGARFRLSNDERAEVAFLLAKLDDVRHAEQLPWAKLKPILADARREALLSLLEAGCAGRGWSRTGLDYCRERLKVWSDNDLNPEPLVTGEDVAALGVPKGPKYKQLLDAVRTAQLNEEVTEREAALILLKLMQEFSCRN